MTKSTITRERIQRIIRAINSEAYDEEEIREWLSSDEIMELSRMALAAMDSEPVAIIDQANLDYLRSGADADVWPPEREEMGDVLLYRHPQPAPVVPEEMTPEMMRSVQLNSELGAYAASNLSGAYDLFAEFWKVACRAAMQEVKP